MQLAAGLTGNPPLAVAGQNIIVGLVINTVLGLACYFGFVLFRSRFGIYYKRLLMRGLASPPPVMRLGGWAQLYSWLIPVFTVSDAELLRSCGLDALVRSTRPCRAALVFSAFSAGGSC